MLAQHLQDAGCPAEIVYLDLSTASRAIAEARAKARGLDNIRFLNGSLLDLPQLGLGLFDYIDCCGVLHHLERSGSRPCRAGAGAEAGGGMGIMVYGRHGRTGVYQVQAMLRDADAGGAGAGQHAEGAAEDWRAPCWGNCPPTNWLRRNPAVGDHLEAGDAGLYDLLLHSRDRAYDVAELAELVAGAGLEITSFIEPWRYDPESYLSDPELLRRVARLDAIARAGFAELLAGNLKRHIVYLVPRGQPARRIASPAIQRWCRCCERAATAGSRAWPMPAC